MGYRYTFPCAFIVGWIDANAPQQLVEMIQHKKRDVLAINLDLRRAARGDRHHLWRRASVILLDEPTAGA